MKAIPFLAFIFALILTPPLQAQTDEDDDTTQQQPVADTLDSLDIDTTAQEREQPRKSVPTAMLLSTFIPGGGQFYNQRYIKGAVIAGGEITLGYFTVRRHLDMLDAKASDPPDTAAYYQARDQRNIFAFFTGAVIAYAVADAYVDAHMFGFSQAQTLSVVPSSRGLGLAIRYRF